MTEKFPERKKTRHRHADKDLALSEESYRLVVENANDIIWKYDLSSQSYSFISPAVTRILGYSVEEAMKKRLENIYPPATLKKVNRAYGRLFKGEIPDNRLIMEVEHYKKDGSVVLMEVSSYPIFDAKGKVIGMAGVTRDITDRKRTEDALRKSEQRYRDILETMREGYFELDLEGNYTFANEANCRFLGYTKEELIGKNFRIHTPQEAAKKVIGPYRELYKTGKPIESLDLESFTKSGRKVIYETSVSLIKDDKGNPVGFRGISRDVTVRKQMEEDLRGREEKMQSIFRAAPTGIGVIINRVFVDVNDRFCQMTGYKKEELIGKSARLVYATQEEFDRVGAEKYRQIAEKGTGSVETQFKKKDGTIIDILLSSTPIYSSDLSRGVTFTALDITTRKKTEDALRESEEKYRTILESIDDGYYEIDLEGKYTFFNDAEAKNLGYTREEMRGVNSRKYQDEETYKRTFKAFMELYRTGETIKALEMEAIRKDGTKVFNEISASVIRDKKGKPMGFRGITRNITQRKRAEEALKQSEQKYRFLTESMTDIIWIAGLDLRTTYITPSIQRVLGFTQEERVSQSLEQQLTPDSLTLVFDTFNRELVLEKQGAADPSRRVDLQLEYYHKDGSTRWLHVTISGIRDEESVLTGIYGVARDITEQKLIEDEIKKNRDDLIQKNIEIEDSRKNLQITLEKLEAAYEELKTSQAKILQQEKMASIGQLAAGVAHEINNPVAFISSNLSTLEKYIRRLNDFIGLQTETIKHLKTDSVGNDLEEKRKELKINYTISDAQKLLGESLDGTDRVQKIVQSLNRFSRLDDADYRETDINECIEQSINIVWNELKYKGALHRDYGMLSPVKCYPQQLSQVFINLLLNAAQAISEKGEITIKTREKNKEIYISISDTGTGISEDNKRKIFEPFFTTKEVGKGTGLGLSISYEIIQRHKGDILFESRQGRGTTFIVKLPVVS